MWKATPSAYKGFSGVNSRLAGNEREGLEPEYYMAQIDYTRGEYGKVTELGQSLLRHNPVDELLPETERIVGLSWFKLDEYGNARKYLESYLKHEEVTPAADAVYALGVIEYDEGDLDSAQRRFATLTDLNNDLAQSAYLYLGQIAIKENDNNAAAVSFEKASRMNFDPDVTETALFNYIAARTHGGNIPFSSSIPLLTGFLQQFPRSQYAGQVEEYLATAYFNEKDYARALESVNRISRPSASVIAAKQKILYELGMEQMADQPSLVCPPVSEGSCGTERRRQTSGAVLSMAWRRQLCPRKLQRG